VVLWEGGVLSPVGKRGELPLLLEKGEENRVTEPTPCAKGELLKGAAQAL